jgi:hypothetical protein
MSKNINENKTKLWIDSLSEQSFIDNSHRRYIDKSILNNLPLLQYNEKQWKKLFIAPPNNNYKDLQLTSTGIYSIGQPDIIKELLLFVKEQIKNVNLDNNTLTITETNGGLGGFSSILLKEFNNINIVELNPTHYKIIQNNLKVYGFDKLPNKNITIYQGDYLDKMFELNQDIIISDPPWGGRNYIKKPAIRLGFDNIDIVEVINKLNSENKFILFIFLAPVNFNFNLFLSKIQSNKISIRKVRSHNFVCIMK